MKKFLALASCMFFIATTPNYSFAQEDDADASSSGRKFQKGGASSSSNQGSSGTTTRRGSTGNNRRSASPRPTTQPSRAATSSHATTYTLDQVQTANDENENRLDSEISNTLKSPLHPDHVYDISAPSMALGYLFSPSSGCASAEGAKKEVLEKLKAKYFKSATKLPLKLTLQPSANDRLPGKLIASVNSLKTTKGLVYAPQAGNEAKFHTAGTVTDDETKAESYVDVTGSIRGISPNQPLRQDMTATLSSAKLVIYFDIGSGGQAGTDAVCVEEFRFVNSPVAFKANGNGGDALVASNETSGDSERPAGSSRTARSGTAATTRRTTTSTTDQPQGSTTGASSTQGGSTSGGSAQGSANADANAQQSGEAAPAADATKPAATTPKSSGCASDSSNGWMVLTLLLPILVRRRFKLAKA